MLLNLGFYTHFKVYEKSYKIVNWPAKCKIKKRCWRDTTITQNYNLVDIFTNFKHLCLINRSTFLKF